MYRCTMSTQSGGTVSGPAWEPRGHKLGVGGMRADLLGTRPVRPGRYWE